MKDSEAPSEAADLTRVESLLAEIQTGLNRIDRLLAAEPPRLQAEDIQIMRHLLRAGPERVGALAAHLGNSRATMSARLDRLEQLGLVDRERPAGDRRAVVARLTSGGRARAEASIQARLAVIEALDESIPIRALDTAARLAQATDAATPRAPAGGS